MSLYVRHRTGRLVEADTAELGEALDLILTGYTGEEETVDETGEGTA